MPSMHTTGLMYETVEDKQPAEPLEDKMEKIIRRSGSRKKLGKDPSSIMFDSELN